MRERDAYTRPNESSGKQRGSKKQKQSKKQKPKSEKHKQQTLWEHKRQTKRGGVKHSVDKEEGETKQTFRSLLVLFCPSLCRTYSHLLLPHAFCLSILLSFTRTHTYACSHGALIELMLMITPSGDCNRPSSRPLPLLYSSSSPFSTCPAYLPKQNENSAGHLINRQCQPVSVFLLNGFPAKSNRRNEKMETSIPKNPKSIPRHC